jgi:hypothetical protein
MSEDPRMLFVRVCAKADAGKLDACAQRCGVELAA